ncbi:MAG: hypothetical protein CMB61_03040 [Euryarchaeota archaeon]|nr:hypothetical protein [Euryarchaeota archaeon]
MIRAVAFDCDGVLTDNGSSWQMIHKHFSTGSDDNEEHQETLRLFFEGEISEEDFVEHDIAMWRKSMPEIHRDDIMRCYSGTGLMDGAREVVQSLKERGIFVAIVSSGVDLFVGAIASMLKVDDWVANGFEWDDDGILVRGLPTRVHTHNKGLMVEKLARINGLDPSELISVGDSGTDLSMKIKGSKFIGFNPTRDRAVEKFEDAGVPIVRGKDLRMIWKYIFPEEGGYPS